MSDGPSDQAFEEKLQRIKIAQRNAAELQVIIGLRQKGLIEDESWETITGLNAAEADEAFDINQ